MHLVVRIVNLLHWHDFDQNELVWECEERKKKHETKQNKQKKLLCISKRLLHFTILYFFPFLFVCVYVCVKFPIVHMINSAMNVVDFNFCIVIFFGWNGSFLKLLLRKKTFLLHFEIICYIHFSKQDR